MHSPVRFPYGFHYNEINEMSLSLGFRSFGLSLVSIFIPIYLYKLGYSLHLVFAYFFLEQFFKCILVYPTCTLIAKYGPKHILAFSYVFMFSHLLLLYALNFRPISLLIITLVSAISTNTHWLSFHINFSNVVHPKKSSQEISNLSMVVYILTALGPIIGGLAATWYGIDKVLLVAIFFICMAIYPLFKTRETLPNCCIDLKKIQFKNIRHDLIGYSSYGVDQMIDIIWPFFIFLSLSTYAQVGLITGLGLGISTIAFVVVGRLADNGYRQHFIRNGSIFNSFIHLLRGQVGSFGPMLLVDVADNVGHIASRVPWQATVYQRAGEEGRIEYFMAMETGIDISRGAFWLILFALSFLFPAAAVLRIGFILAAVASLLVMNMGTKRVVKPA